MLNICWLGNLSLKLKQLRWRNPNLRVAIIGVGNELRGDDALGALIIRALQPNLEDCKDVLILNVGAAPENFCGVLRRFDPDWVLMLDAAHMEEKPGTVRWIDPDSTSGKTISTHALPLPVLVAYLEVELNCEVSVLGIQPANVDLGMPVSAQILRAVETVSAVLTDCLKAGDHVYQTQPAKLYTFPCLFPETEKGDLK